MRLILDSSVIVEGDWHLSGPAAKALLSSGTRGGCQLLVPEVVLREVATKYAERERKAMNMMAEARANLQRLHDGVATREADEVKLDSAHSDYVAMLHEKLDAANAQVLPLPAVPHDELLERALERRRPFDQGGRAGYRDTLLWLSVLDVVDNGELTVFATANTRDFADEHDRTTLHPHLREDLRARELQEDAVRSSADPSKRRFNSS